LRKASGAPKLRVPMSSDLGNVTPVFIVPGAWSEKDMHRCIESLMETAFLDTGCNCLSPKAVFIAAKWDQCVESSLNCATVHFIRLAVHMYGIMTWTTTS
jgi:acyl-CoA reductase-like NAD-dependent aldehyde dehydrogenase